MENGEKNNNEVITDGEPQCDSRGQEHLRRVVRIELGIKRNYRWHTGMTINNKTVFLMIEVLQCTDA